MLPSSGSILAPGAQLLGGPKIPNSETQHCSKQPFKYKAKIERKVEKNVIMWPLIVTAVYLELNKVESMNHYLTAAIMYHIFWHVLYDKQQSFILSNSCDIFKAYTFVWCFIGYIDTDLLWARIDSVAAVSGLKCRAPGNCICFMLNFTCEGKVVPVMWFHLSVSQTGLRSTPAELN